MNIRVPPHIRVTNVMAPKARAHEERNEQDLIDEATAACLTIPSRRELSLINSGLDESAWVSDS